MLDAGWLWPILISALKSVVLLVVLLIYTAYVLYAERIAPRKAYFEFDDQPAMMMP